MTIKNTDMLFNLKEIKEAVDWATGDDGFRGKEVVEILKQTRNNPPVISMFIKDKGILDGDPDVK